MICLFDERVPERSRRVDLMICLFEERVPELAVPELAEGLRG
jgi:hypothetical protein